MNTVLITGASSGIGKATSSYFINNNYKVIGLDILENINALIPEESADYKQLFEERTEETEPFGHGKHP